MITLISHVYYRFYLNCDKKNNKYQFHYFTISRCLSTITILYKAVDSIVIKSVRK